MEGGRETILMINIGCFKDLDICIMVYSSQVILKPVGVQWPELMTVLQLPTKVM